MRLSRKRLLAAGLVCVAVAAAGREGWFMLRSTALILDLTGAAPAARRWLPVRPRDVRTEDVTVPARHGAVPARLYRPDVPTGASIVVFPGVHGGGLDEPRMAALSSRLASTGLTVLTAPLPELRAYTIRPRSTDDIEDVLGWAASTPSFASGGRVGVVGVSFSGGLALVAAGRPSLAGKLTFVAALGSHGDLPRAMRFLCTGDLADGRHMPPHDYGAAIILLAALPHFAPPDQLPALRAAIVRFLDASGLTTTDPDRAARMFGEAETMGAALPEPARGVMGWVNRRDVGMMGPKLLPWIEALGGDPALSPTRSAAPRVPVFLLHGASDNVIPYTETPALEAWLRAGGNRQVRSLLTPLISHADVQTAPRAADVWRLVRFWAATLRVASE